MVFVYSCSFLLYFWPCFFSFYDKYEVKLVRFSKGEIICSKNNKLNEILFQSLEKTSNFAEFRELVFGEIVRLEVHNAVQRIQNKRN